MKKLSSFSWFMKLCCALSLLNIHCGKSKDGIAAGAGAGSSTYYIKFKVDGTWREFRGNTLGQLTSEAGGSNVYNANVVALKDAGNASSNSIGIVISTTSPVAANRTYTQKYIPGTYQSEAFLSYTDEVGNIYASMNSTLVANAYASVTITAIQAAAVKGTFSGRVYDASLSFSHQITEGEFNVKR